MTDTAKKCITCCSSDFAFGMNLCVTARVWCLLCDTTSQCSLVIQLYITNVRKYFNVVKLTKQSYFKVLLCACSGTLYHKVFTRFVSRRGFVSCLRTVDVQTFHYSEHFQDFTFKEVYFSLYSQVFVFLLTIRPTLVLSLEDVCRTSHIYSSLFVVIDSPFVV